MDVFTDANYMCPEKTSAGAPQNPGAEIDDYEETIEEETTSSSWWPSWLQASSRPSS
jgi:hypothetical protein